MKNRITTILSAVQGNGSKYVAVNLAKEAMRVEDDVRILLVDLDFDAPFLADELIDEKTTKGIDQLLTLAANGQVTAEQLAANVTASSLDVDVLTGTAFVGRSAHIGSDQVQLILEVAKETYDHVIVVTPIKVDNPALPYALLLADKVVLMVRKNQTNYGRLPRAIQLIGQYYAGNEPIAVVYNFHSDSPSIDVNEQLEKANLPMEVVGVLKFDEKSVDNVDILKKSGLFAKAVNTREIKTIYEKIQKEESE